MPRVTLPVLSRLLARYHYLRQKARCHLPPHMAFPRPALDFQDGREASGQEDIADFITCACAGRASRLAPPLGTAGLFEVAADIEIIAAGISRFQRSLPCRLEAPLFIAHTWAIRPL